MNMAAQLMYEKKEVRAHWTRHSEVVQWYTTVMMVQIINDKCWFILEQIHRLCEHGVGRRWNLRVPINGDAGLNKVHGRLQVAERFAELVALQRHNGNIDNFVARFWVGCSCFQ